MLGALFSKTPYSTAKWYMVTGAIWAVIGAFYGFLAALTLFAPDLISQNPWFSFGRLRPIHVNIVAFGFVYSLLLGAGAYIVPRLLKVDGLWSEPLGKFGVILWNAVFLGAIHTLHTGQTQARELAELVWWVDWLVAISLIMYAINIYMCLATRKEKTLYVTVWYIAGGITWTVTVYFIGNVMWTPSGSLSGIMDAIWLWFYGHNVVGLILTPAAVGAAYWILPRAVKRPVWSHTMSLVGFWVLLVMYTHTGTHHLIQAPVPQWLKVISIVDSMALLIPVFTVLFNLWLPMRGRLGVLHEDIGARFVFVGTIWYAIVCVQGPMQSLPSVQKLTHFTHWVVAHSHIAILGFAGFIAMGATYTLLPLITKKPLYSKSLANLTYWIIMFGLVGMFVVLTAAGLIQGGGWLNGEAFYRVMSQLHFYMMWRAVTGLAILGSLVLFAYNVFKTIAQPADEVDEEKIPSPLASESISTETA
jgi:cytochrome c oxidase cbb3-type subunit 1